MILSKQSHRIFMMLTEQFKIKLRLYRKYLRASLYNLMMLIFRSFCYGFNKISFLENLKKLRQTGLDLASNHSSQQEGPEKFVHIKSCKANFDLLVF